MFFCFVDEIVIHLELRISMLRMLFEVLIRCNVKRFCLI